MIGADERDAELVARTRGGDAGAYATLMRRHFDKVFAVALRLTGNVEDAEDACQEAFTRGYFRLEKCGDPARFEGWITAVARHHAHNLRRYQALRAAASLDDHASVKSADDSARSTELREMQAHLSTALGSLSPVQRTALLHFEVDGWTHAQIAVALDISVLMSRRHVSDARALLRQLLTKTARDYFKWDNTNE